MQKNIWMMWSHPIKPVLLSNDEITFPDPKQADAEGLVAIGGDLSPQRLLQAYRQGIFPWYETGFPILWWSPDPRLILKPASFKISKSLKKTLKKPFIFKVDTAFASVIKACSESSGRLNQTWITAEMQDAYIALHEKGYAHSFEVWYDNQLAGGLYGISLGRAFFGESMFHHIRDASKLALYFLCQISIHLRLDFIDCQLPTNHLIGLGAATISRYDFLKRLNQALFAPSLVGKWQTPQALPSNQI